MTRVLRGRRGAFVVQMDLGSQQRCEEDGLEYRPRCLPWRKLPAGLKDAIEASQGNVNKRPDGLLYKPARGELPAEFWIVEVKICRDTEPDATQNRAEAQHQQLIDSIKIVIPNAKTHYMPILVGVTGTIYDRTASFLRELGVRDSSLNHTVLKPVPGSGSRAECAQFRGSSDAKHVSSWFQPWATLWPTCHMLVPASLLQSVECSTECKNSIFHCTIGCNKYKSSLASGASPQTPPGGLFLPPGPPPPAWVHAAH